MLLLKNSLISHPQFQQALQGLAQKKMPVKTAFNLKVLANRIEQKIKDSDKVKLDLLHQYCEKEESGEFKNYTHTIKKEDGTEEQVKQPGTVVPKAETKEEFEKAFQDFLNHTHEIKGDKISAESLGDIEMSAAEIHLLEPIFDLGEEAEAISEGSEVLPFKK